MPVSRRLLLSGAASAALAQEKTAPRKEMLRAGYWGTQFYGAEERRELHDVLETGRPFRFYGAGSVPPDKARTFEREFAARMQTRYALGVTSGTAALQCAMAALGVGPGDEVILPAWTWHSCYAAILLSGALPVFAEIDESFNIDPDDIERQITPQTKVILAVHLQGSPADLERILAIARKHKIRVLEDCAQSVGAAYRGKPLGSWGDIGIYSLQLNKTITAGEGGAVVTSDPLLFERAVRFHDVGFLRQTHEDWLGDAKVAGMPGANYRLNEFSAGVLLAQTRKLDRIVALARANARRVRQAVSDLPGVKFRRQYDPEGDLGVGVFFEFASRQRRDAFLEAMRRRNIHATPPGGSVILPVQPYILQKLTTHPAWPTFRSDRGRTIQYGPECCPKTRDILDRFGGVLIDPKYTASDCAEIAAAVRAVWPEVLRA